MTFLRFEISMSANRQQKSLPAKESFFTNLWHNFFDGLTQKAKVLPKIANFCYRFQKNSCKITLPQFCKQRPKRPYFLSVTKYFVQLLSRKQNNLGGLKYCNQVCSILSRTMFCIHSLQFMTSHLEGAIKEVLGF